MSTEEIRTIVALRKGDEKAFDAIFRKYGAELYHFSLSMTRNETEAQEILQETFLKVWENRKTLDPERNFRNYLISIAKHLIYNAFRHRLVVKKYARPDGHTPSGAADIEDNLYLDELRDSLSAGIRNLAPHQREVLILKIQGLNNDEIAEALNISKRTVEYHINKSYKQLRSELKHLKDIFGLILSLI